MSRMGKKPIIAPQGVTLTEDGVKVKIKGPKGELNFVHNPLIVLRIEKGEIWIDRKNDGNEAKAHQGLVHRMLSNMVTGVTTGFVKKLEIQGVGYRAAVEGKELVLQIGFCQPVRYAIPADVKVAVDKNVSISIEGIDKQKVGQVAAEIKKIRKPDPYKGKGIRYEGEHIAIKPGKAAVGSGF